MSIEKKIIVSISDEEKKLHKKFLESQVPKSFMIN